MSGGEDSKSATGTSTTAAALSTEVAVVAAGEGVTECIAIAAADGANPSSLFFEQCIFKTEIVPKRRNTQSCVKFCLELKFGQQRLLHHQLINSEQSRGAIQFLSIWQPQKVN